MLRIHRPSTLLALPLHHHRRRRSREPQLGNSRPPVQYQLSIYYTTVTCKDHHLLLRSQLHICRARRLDSNAEPFRTQNFNYDFDDDVDDSSVEGWDGVLEEYIDSIWIFKVFRSYGWALPFILASMLLANGLKSFLMALALPLGQSTISFAIKKIWERKGKRRKRHKAKTMKSRTVNLGKEKTARSQKVKDAKMRHQSWVSPNDDSTFGGWEQLDERSEFQLGPSYNSGQGVGRSQKPASEKSRLSRSIKEGDTPLLLRLLIAVFPFLASWTKML